MTKFLKGIDGWYFLNNDSNKVIDEISGANALSQHYALKWRAIFTERQVKADEFGVTLVTFIVPNKHCVFPQFLPADIQISDQRLVLIGDFDELQSVIYDSALFSDPDTFHKNDTHWTDYGACQAFIRIMSEFNIEPQRIYTKDSFSREYCQGDLTGSNGDKKELVLKNEDRVKEVFDNGILHVGRVRIYKNEKLKGNGNGKRLSIFGGSSVNQIIDFFAHEFEIIVHVWTQSIDWEVVKEYRCNYVLALPRERFMVQVATDDQSWEYQQGNALKYLEGVAYSSLNTKGTSSYFGQIGYRNAIDLLASSLLALNIAGKSTAVPVQRIVNTLDVYKVDALILKLKEMGAEVSLLNDLKSQSLLTEKAIRIFKVSLNKEFNPRLLRPLLGMNLSDDEFREVLLAVNKSICSGQLLALNKADIKEVYVLYSQIIEKLESKFSYKSVPLHGFSDGVFGSSIKGWCYTKGIIKQGVELRINDIPIAEHKSELYRKDLDDHGMGDGKHGFSFNLNLKRVIGMMQNSQHAEVAILDKSTGTIIPKSQMLIKVPCTSFYIDNYAVNDFSGWIVDYSYPTRKIILDVFVNGAFVKKVSSSIVREDLKDENFNEAIGFNFSLKNLLENGDNSLIFKDSETGLIVSNEIRVVL